jgi:hypothetical protein
MQGKTSATKTEPVIRPAEPRDDPAIARLLYETASGRYDLFTGGRERALRLLAATVATPGNDTSRDGVVVAELDGEVAGVVAAFPTREGDERRRRWLRMAYRRRAPWHWPGMRRSAARGEAIPLIRRPTRSTSTGSPPKRASAAAAWRPPCSPRPTSGRVSSR